MPFPWGSGGAPTVSRLTFDTDLVVPAAFKITVDHIGETTGGHGIVHDNKVKVDHIAEATAAHKIVADSVLGADHIAEVTSGHGIMHNSNLLVSQDLVVASRNLHGGVLYRDVTADTTVAHNNDIDLDCATVPRHGCKLTLGAGTYLSKCIFYIQGTNGNHPTTGTYCMRVRRVDTDAVIAESFESGNAADIVVFGTGLTAYTFNFPAPSPLYAGAIYAAIEYTGADGSVDYDRHTASASLLRYHYTGGAWVSDGANESMRGTATVATRTATT